VFREAYIQQGVPQGGSKPRVYLKEALSPGYTTGCIPQGVNSGVYHRVYTPGCTMVGMYGV